MACYGFPAFHQERLARQQIHSQYLPRQNIAYASPTFVSPTFPHRSNTMVNTLTPPSFFAEEMWHYEQPRAEGIMQLPLVEPTSAHSYPFRPLLSTAGASLLTTMPPDALIKTESAALTMPGILDGPVDQTQYEPVGEREWLHAAIDYDATSPDSLASTSPLTPSADFSGPFTEHFLANGQHQSNTVATSFLAQHQDIKPLPQPPQWSSVPTGYYPPRDGTQLLQNVFDHNAHRIIEPGMVTASEPLHHPQPMRRYTPPGAFQWADTTPSYSGVDCAVSAEYEESVQGTEKCEAVESDQDVSIKPKKLSASNEALIRMRNEGISYKEIRRRLNLREAESTLRGRVRMLTKDKSERVRKPTWSPDDLRILRRAVNHFAAQSRARTGKIPWKMVSKWMQENGGSYAFGPATCAKKWDAINHQ